MLLTTYTTSIIHVPTLISIATLAYLVHLTYELVTSSLTNSSSELDRTHPSTNPGLLSWLYTTLVLVALVVLSPLSSLGVALYTLLAWFSVSLVCFVTSCLLVTSVTSSTTTSSSPDLIAVTTVGGLLNRIGSWLYILGYLTVRMWLVFALHGFCTASISTLIDSVNGSMPVLGLIILVVGGLCTLGYVVIQTYVYVSFVLMYYRSDVSSYYPLLALVTVSLTALLPTTIGIPVLLALLLISSALYCSCPLGVALPSSTHSTSVSTGSPSSTLGTRLDVSGRSWLGVSTGSTTVMWIPLLVCTHVGLGVLTPIYGFYAGVALTVLSLCGSLCSESTSVSQYRSDSTCYAWLLLCEVIAFLSVGSYYALVVGLDTVSTLTLFGVVPWSISEVMCLLSLLVLLLVTLYLEYAVRSHTLSLTTSSSEYPLVDFVARFWGEGGSISVRCVVYGFNNASTTTTVDVPVKVIVPADHDGYTPTPRPNGPSTRAVAVTIHTINRKGFGWMGWQRVALHPCKPDPSSALVKALSGSGTGMWMSHQLAVIAGRPNPTLRITILVRDPDLLYWTATTDVVLSAE